MPKETFNQISDQFPCKFLSHFCLEHWSRGRVTKVSGLSRKHWTDLCYKRCSIINKWVLKRREGSGFARVNKVTSASLGYPLSVFNKNSTLTSNFANFCEFPSNNDWNIQRHQIHSGLGDWVELIQRQQQQQQPAQDWRRLGKSTGRSRDSQSSQLVQSRNSNSSVSCGTNSKWDLNSSIQIQIEIWV